MFSTLDERYRNVYNYKVLSTREDQKENNRKTIKNLSDITNYFFKMDHRYH